MFKKVPGTKDILPVECFPWQKIEQISRRIFSVYNFKEIRTPLIEDVVLFNRSLGQATEIVQKQMFLINNKEDTYALRPEGTASIVRAYIENNLHKTDGFLKMYYIGPMFRLERPQKGRLRQFHHLGCEVIGSADANLDVEVISLADSLLKAYGIEGYKIKINSLGCAGDKQKLSEILKQGLKNNLSQLCEDCKSRFERNVLRILDCKNKSCQETVVKLNIQDSYLCEECNGHFEKVKSGLDLLKVKYEICPFLVRGLDYYTRTVFEIQHNELGSQDAIGAGGRYDNLVKELGGPELGSIGFAFGIERLLLVTNHKSEVKSQDENLVYLAGLGEEAKIQVMLILGQLRNSGIICDTDYESKSLKGIMRKANDLGAKYMLIIGEDELKKSVVTVKNMSSGEQKEVQRDKLLEELKSGNQ
ncbi:MAG: histidine--tRNA ligase [Candidatus Omnitrophota bacterium]